MTDRTLRSIAIICLLLACNYHSFAQKAPIKFGKIDPSHLSMTQYEHDTSAQAVILCDYGTTNLEYETTTSEFYVSISRHVRFKILGKAGYNYADFEIPLYRAGNDIETIVKFKAAVYNLENDKTITTDVKKSELLMDERSEHWIVQKLAMPEVKEGTVFEIHYIVRSPFFWNLQDWNFQNSIPILYSEYRTEHPEWFNYKKSIKGYDYSYITSNEEDTGSNRITFSGFRRSGGYVAKSTAVHNTIDFQTYKNRWIAEKMPAFKSEAYTSSINNFLTSIKFELASTQFPNSPIDYYTKSWEDINQELMGNSNFGLQLGKMKTAFLKDKVASLIAGKETPLERAGAIFYHVQSKMTWDKRQTKYASSSLRRAYEEGKGNCSDINLLLTSMLRMADLEAHPVILSTRDNGYVNPYYPSMRQFNYVVASIHLGEGKYILMDATDKTLPADLLPPRCINSQGLLISKAGPKEMPINPSGKFRKAIQCKLKLNEDGEWAGTMDVSRRDYATRELRANLNPANEEDFILKVQSDNEGLKISESAFENVNKIDQDTKERYQVTITDQTIDAGDMLYFNPMLMFGETENLFKLEERKYPVDYNYPVELIFSGQFEIPEGYTIEEVPEKAIVALPENGGRFVYTISTQGNAINLTSQIQIKKHLFLPMEYQSLKEFYNLIIEKHGAQVVLKKKT